MKSRRPGSHCLLLRPMGVFAIAAITSNLLLGGSRAGTPNDPLADKKPPGSVPGFAAALAHFDLQIPVANGASITEVKTLTSDPIAGFAAGPSYRNFFWA